MEESVWSSVDDQLPDRDRQYVNELVVRTSANRVEVLQGDIRKTNTMYQGISGNRVVYDITHWLLLPKFQK